MYALQALACTVMEDREEMVNFNSINLILSQSLMQSQEKILELPKQLQALQAKENKKKPTTEKPVLDKNIRDNKLKCYCWIHGRTYSIDHTSAV